MHLSNRLPVVTCTQQSRFALYRGKHNTMPEGNTMYEEDSMVAMYLEFHYGREYLGVPNFPVRCITEAVKYVRPGHTGKALDVGCASGRASFELAKVFEQVDAVDMSTRLIEGPVRLQTVGKQHYKVVDEGELYSHREINLNDFDGYERIKERISFAQGDACNLNSTYDGYDLVFAGNLLDRLYEPSKFLNSIKEKINPGGVLVLTSPYTWLEEHTPRAAWIGGFKAGTGENLRTLEGLKEHMSPEFELEGEATDIPFVIRETQRKYQHTFAQFSVWRKTGYHQDFRPLKA